jgi:hypothetical protein
MKSHLSFLMLTTFIFMFVTEVYGNDLAIYK